MQNNEPKKLKMPSFPKMVGELRHSVQFLKLFSVGMLMISLFLAGIIMSLVTDELPVITLDSCGNTKEQTVLPKAEDQIREGLKYYLGKRYQWGPDNVVKKLKESEDFITPQAVRAFQTAVATVSKFSVDKIVTQRVYPDKIDIDLKKGTALVTGDRVTSIQGLKAAGDMRLELSFESGPRTKANPWGLYISKEREE